jgi:hypothetical protein
VNNFVPLPNSAQFLLAVTQHLVHRAIGKVSLRLNVEDPDPYLGIVENASEKLFRSLTGLFLGSAHSSALRSLRPSQRTFMEHDHKIDGTRDEWIQSSLCIGALTRRARCGQNFADPHASCLFAECRSFATSSVSAVFSGFFIVSFAKKGEILTSDRETSATFHCQ